jgi:hypothetical protein
MSDIARSIRKLSFSGSDQQLMWKERGAYHLLRLFPHLSLYRQIAA